MLLFAASTNLSCGIFTYANEKFISVFVRVFIKSDATGPHFLQIQLQIEKFSCNSEPAVCASAPNRLGLVLYDVLNYNDVIFTADSYESVKHARFTDV